MYILKVNVSCPKAGKLTHYSGLYPAMLENTGRGTI